MTLSSSLTSTSGVTISSGNWQFSGTNTSAGLGATTLQGGSLTLTSSNNVGSIKLAGGLLKTTSSCILGTSNVVLVGSTTSVWNLNGTALSGGTFTIPTANYRMAYSGTGIATLNIQNGCAYLAGVSLSPMSSSGGSATVVNIASNANWWENSGQTDYLAGLTGNGYFGCGNAGSLRTTQFMPAAGAVYNFSGTTYNPNTGGAGGKQNSQLIMKGTGSGTQILSGKWSLQNTANVTVTSGNLVFANSSGNILNAAVAVNGGALYVNNLTNYAVDQPVNVAATGGAQRRHHCL